MHNILSPRWTKTLVRNMCVRVIPDGQDNKIIRTIFNKACRGFSASRKSGGRRVAHRWKLWIWLIPFNLCMYSQFIEFQPRKTIKKASVHQYILNIDCDVVAVPGQVNFHSRKPDVIRNRGEGETVTIYILIIRVNVRTWPEKYWQRLW